MDPRSSKPDSRPTVAREPGDTNPADRTAAYRPAGADAFLAPPERPGELGWLGPYRILGELGRGGMGVVYRAEDPRLKRQLAIKVLLPQAAGDPQAVARFRREAQAQAKVSHDNVIVIYGVEEANGVTLITMPLLRGQTLAEALRRNPRPPVAEVLRVAREMAEGLAAAHAAGLVHRDIKPANVWLEHPKRRVKILDFGLACGPRGATAAAGGRPLAASFDVQLTRAGAVTGTPAYMSPEQAAAREADSRTDLWSLGVVLYQMATGEKPFPGRTSLEVMLAVTQDEPLPAHARAPDLPPRLSDLIRRLLAKEPANRPPSAESVAEELAAAEQHLAMLSVQVIPFGPLPDTPAAPNPWADIDVTSAETVVAAAPPRASPPVQAASPGSSRKWRRPAVGALGAVVLAALVVAGVSALRPKQKPAESVVEEPKLPNKLGPGPKAAPAGTIDLLALIDLKQDAVKGRWKMVDGKLVGGGEAVIAPIYELLQVRYAPPAEYDTTLVVERVRSASVGLPPGDPGHVFVVAFAGPNRFHLMLDANIYDQSHHGLHMLDGKAYYDNEAKFVGDFFKDGTKVPVECRVRRNSVAVWINGRERLLWKGDAGRLSGAEPNWSVADKTYLSLGLRYAEYRVHGWTLTPVTGPPADPAQLEEARLLQLPVLMTNGAGMRMTLIPPGTFQMGSTARPNELPAHAVTITKPFYIGAHEVTVGQFRQFVTESGYKPGMGGTTGGAQTPDAKLSWDAPGYEQTNAYPVSAVSWEDATAYCAWLSKREARAYRLPTEAEWEYAARAGTTTKWFFGDKDLLDEYANHNDLNVGRPEPTGRRKPNPWGLYDVYGNVWEWCSDRYDGTSGYPAGPRTDPTGPTDGDNRMIRGGGWVSGGRGTLVRSAYRYDSSPTPVTYRHNGTGFRVVTPVAP